MWDMNHTKTSRYIKIKGTIVISQNPAYADRWLQQRLLSPTEDNVIFSLALIVCHALTVSSTSLDVNREHKTP